MDGKCHCNTFQSENAVLMTKHMDRMFWNWSHMDFGNILCRKKLQKSSENVNASHFNGGRTCCLDISVTNVFILYKRRKNSYRSSLPWTHFNLFICQYAYSTCDLFLPLSYFCPFPNFCYNLNQGVQSMACRSNSHVIWPARLLKGPKIWQQGNCGHSPVAKFLRPDSMASCTIDRCAGPNPGVQDQAELTQRQSRHREARPKQHGAWSGCAEPRGGGLEPIWPVDQPCDPHLAHRAQRLGTTGLNPLVSSL